MTVPAEDPPNRAGRDRWPRWLLLDLGPVLLLGLIAVLGSEPGPRPTDGAVLLVTVLPLLLRRSWPIPVLVVVAVGAVVSIGRVAGPWATVPAVMLAAFTVGERARDRLTSAMVIVAVAAVVSLGVLAQDAEPLEAIVLPFAVLVPAWLLGDVVRWRRLAGERRADDLAGAMREREERLAAAAAEERRHVARELHDVVSHAVSVMVIQAGAARQVLRSSPGDAEQALLAVESTGRDAMTELRRFLGTLSAEDESAGVAPQPGIGALPGLLERVREAGLPASFEVAGDVRAIPTSVEVTVFRIAQEALTNALRYAGHAATLVRLSWEPDQLRLEILDDGPGGASAPEGAGRGLAGMRERVTLVGGRLEAGPRVGGGYAVRAWLPLEPPLGPGALTP